MSSDFLPSLLSNIWAIFLVIIFFGGSIFVHELGHFLAARRRGVHVERFSIGFGPAIWAWRGKDGVEYRLSWIPLGGYVLLPQLADLGPVEGEVKSDVAKMPPVGYATKMIVFVAGATFNIIFAFLLACVVSVIGQPTFAELETTKVGAISETIKLPDGTTAPNPAIEAGLQPGDIILSIDGRKVTNFEEIATGIFLGKKLTDDGRRVSTVVVQRGTEEKTFTVYPRLVGNENARSIGIEPAEDLTVDAVLEGSPAAAAGVKANDRIVAVDDVPMHQRAAVSEHIGQHSTRPVVFSLERGTELVKIPIQPRFEIDERTKRQVARVGVRYRDPIVIIHPNPFHQIGNNVAGTFRLLDALISPSSDIRPSQLSGPVGIVRELHRQAQWDFRRVLWFAILLNVSLAIFNLLPIPVLDGGQMLFATIARLRGKPLPVNFILTSQSVFMVLILGMVLYVTVAGDLRRWMQESRTIQAEAPAAAAPLAPTPAPAK